MASTYTDNLKIELIGTGEQDGTWGTITNTNFGSASGGVTSGFEEAIVGRGNPQFTADSNLTLTLSDTPSTQIARCIFLYVDSTLSLTATRDLIVPTIKKTYIVQNATSGSQSVRVKTTAGTGITIPNGKKMLLYVDDTNVVEQVDYIGALVLGAALPVASGGTGVTSSTGSGANVLSTSPTLVTPILGTPTSGTLTNCTGFPVANISGLGTGVATFLATPSSANLAAAVTGETGTGALVFGTSPTLVTPDLGTPSALVGTNITGTAAGLTAGNVTTNANLTGGVTSVGNAATVVTNANLTGAVTSVGNATSLGSFTSAQLAGAVTNETGTGALVFATSPTLVTPTLGTPASGTLTSCTGLPIVAGTTGTLSVARGGTGVTTSTGSGANVLSTSPTLVTPILGTPTSGTLTNCTGYPAASISGLGTGVATFLATPSSANLAAAVTGETGTGALVFATSPTLVTPTLGTPASGTLTNCTGFPVANISGLGTGVATFLATPSSANLAAAVTGETGTGALVFGTSPTLVTPALGTPSSGTLTSCTGLPIVAGTTGTLSVARGGTGVTTSTGSGNVVLSASPTFTGTLSAATIEATGNITAYYSDERLKVRLENISGALEKICSLSGFYYRGNEIAASLGYSTDIIEVGVSAQEVQRVLPEVVCPAPISDKYLTVRYEKLIPLLIECIKELSSQVAELRGK